MYLKLLFFFFLFVQALEDEIQELRNKLKDKEKECDQLNAELSSAKKKSRSTTKARLEFINLLLFVGWRTPLSAS